MKVLTATRMLPHHGGGLQAGLGGVDAKAYWVSSCPSLWRCAEQSVEHPPFRAAARSGMAGEFLQALAHDNRCNRAVDSSGVPKMHRLRAEQA